MKPRTRLGICALLAVVCVAVLVIGLLRRGDHASSPPDAPVPPSGVVVIDLGQLSPEARAAFLNQHPAPEVASRGGPGTGGGNRDGTGARDGRGRRTGR